MAQNVRDDPTCEQHTHDLGLSSHGPASRTGRRSPMAPQQLTVVIRQRLLDLLVVEKV
jgi:hypothetical protein